MFLGNKPQIYNRLYNCLSHESYCVWLTAGLITQLSSYKGIIFSLTGLWGQWFRFADNTNDLCLSRTSWHIWWLCKTQQVGQVGNYAFCSVSQILFLLRIRYEYHIIKFEEALTFHLWPISIFFNKNHWYIKTPSYTVNMSLLPSCCHIACFFFSKRLKSINVVSNIVSCGTSGKYSSKY